MASLRQTFGQLANLWKQLSTGKKISFVLIFAVMAAAFTVLVLWAGRPDYRVLYENLTLEDANAVVGHLKDTKVKYQLTNGGTTIMVPADSIYEVRMTLANAGLPTGGSVGYELFDRKGLGLTDAQLKIARLRSLQGELARTIQQLDPVESCRVHIAMPKDSLFVEDKKEATASVVLQLVPNARLGEDQVNGIVFLISSSVEGLEPENVTVIDGKGHVLSKPREDQLDGGGLEDKTRKLERQYEHRIETLLARSVGPEKIAARVNVTLDRQQVEKVEEKYNPDEQVVRSQQTVVSEDTSKETQSSSFPGAEANLPQDNYAEGNQTSSAQTKKQETTNYEISRTTATITEAGGSIEKLSVAVLIDGTYDNVEEEGKTNRVYKPRTEAEMATFTEIVKKAIGYNEQRGDQIEVANIPFVAEETEIEQTPAERYSFYMRIVNYALLVVGAVLFLLFVVRPLVRWLTSEPSLEQQLGVPAHAIAGATVGELEARLTGRLGPGAPEEELPEGAEGESRETMTARLQKLNRQKEDLLDTASKDPDAVVLVIRRWLKETERHA